MAINVETQDLENYPGVVKRIIVDQESVVPMGAEGDEKFIMSFSTTAFSDNATRTAIQDLYVTDFKAGWCKSSGFAGSSGKFALDATHNSFEIKIDATTSGIGDGYYRVTLEHNGGVYMDAEVIAADMEQKIRALANTLEQVDAGFRLAYKNAVVDWLNGRFWIVSGSLGKYYSGTNRSSVKVRASSVNDASAVLGFDLSMDSQTLDGMSVKEALVLTDYTATASGTGQMTINQNIGAQNRDCLMITDGTNTDYFQITSTPANGTLLQFNAAMVLHDYDANVAKVQLLREQDPNASPTLWFSDVDMIIRHGIKTMISQVDYSS